jgi:hypothetical protein
MAPASTASPNTATSAAAHHGLPTASPSSPTA